LGWLWPPLRARRDRRADLWLQFGVAIVAEVFVVGLRRTARYKNERSFCA
jgi:hypothetical protein